LSPPGTSRLVLRPASEAARGKRLVLVRPLEPARPARLDVQAVPHRDELVPVLAGPVADVTAGSAHAAPASARRTKSGSSGRPGERARVAERRDDAPRRRGALAPCLVVACEHGGALRRSMSAGGSRRSSNGRGGPVSCAMRRRRISSSCSSDIPSSIRQSATARAAIVSRSGSCGCPGEAWVVEA